MVGVAYDDLDLFRLFVCSAAAPVVSAAESEPAVKSDVLLLLPTFALLGMESAV
jgi:hypothetical protein